MKYILTLIILSLYCFCFGQSKTRPTIGAEAIVASNVQLGSKTGVIFDNIYRLNYNFGANFFMNYKESEFGVGLDYFVQNYKFTTDKYDKEFTDVTFNVRGVCPKLFYRRIIDWNNYHFQLGANASTSVVFYENLMLFGTKPPYSAFDQFTYVTKRRFFYSFGIESMFPLIEKESYSIGLQFQLSYLIHNKLFVFIENSVINKANGVNLQTGIVFKLH